MNPILNIENLTKIYGNVPSQTKALNGITFQVMTGEFLGIMGSSGSGKSTLLNCIASVTQPTSLQNVWGAATAQMFSNLILRNSRRSRKENGLFFSSLVISIIAFYMILSISTQDVMIFLQKMESDAVDRLLQLIPVFYGVTLGILFFLIYFACKYQFECRRHEFGVYLMQSETVYTDRRGLQFMLGQIVSNSIKYSSDSPMLTLSMIHSETADVLSVEDNGIGVKKYDLPYIFQKGFTGDSTDSRKKATGMGLYLVKKMADDLNLHLEATSQWGKGFKIDIFFPKLRSNGGK